MKLRLVAPAKVNWTLEVLRRRDDGYHELRSVLQTIALHDVIVLSLAEHLELKRGGLDINNQEPLEADLAHRAAEALRQEAGKPQLGVLIELEKAIPAGSGLGGGSSDAAATLRGLNQLWELNFDEQRLARIAAGLGSDVPFFLTGGTALLSGRGDEVEPLPDAAPLALTIAIPRDRLQQKTARMYRSLRPMHFTSGERTERLVEKLRVGNSIDDGDIFNAFEPVLFETMPLAAALKVESESEGGRPHLAGAGPAFFFLSAPKPEREERWRRAGVTLIEITTSTRRQSMAWEEL